MHMVLAPASGRAPHFARISLFPTHAAAISHLHSIFSSRPSIHTFIAVPSRSNMSRDRGPRALLEALGAVIVLFFLSWRLAPICSIVIVATGLAAAIYRKHTRTIEQAQGSALSRMTAVALQALDNMKVGRELRGAG